MKHFIASIFFIIAAATQKILPSENRNVICNSLDNTITSQDTLKEPTAVIEKVILNPMSILFISDTAADITDLGKVFATDYSELFTFINQTGLRPGKIMAFYLTYENPLSLEVAVEVDNIPAMLTGRIKSKIVDGGDAVVVHYTGPYEEMEMAYKTISQWLKGHNKQSRGLPFEVYLNDPGTVKDKYELKTDVYQLLQ